MVTVPDIEANICEPFGKDTGMGTMFLYVLKELRLKVMWSVAPVSKIQRVERLPSPVED
jgi:hypothetical protein